MMTHDVMRKTTRWDVLTVKAQPHAKTHTNILKHTQTRKERQVGGSSTK